MYSLFIYIFYFIIILFTVHEMRHLWGFRVGADLP